MALFKIQKGTANNLKNNRPYTNEGYCYFTTDDGKFYIDVEGTGSSSDLAYDNDNNLTRRRICLNAATADRVAHSLIIRINSPLASTEGLTKYTFNGSIADKELTLSGGDGIDITTPGQGFVEITNTGVTAITFNSNNRSTGTVDITGAKLFGSTAVGGPGIPIYWNGSSFEAVSGITGTTTMTIRRWSSS